MAPTSSSLIGSLSEKMGKGLALATIVAVVSVIFGAIQISQAVNQGQLAFPVTYDTNGYFTRSLHYLNSLQNEGVWAFLKEITLDPPRSASTTFFTLIGFSLIGVTDWSPNVVQILEVVLLLFVVLELAKRAHWTLKASLLVYVLCWPISGFLIVENRPDIFWGLTSAAAAHVLLTHDGLSGRRETLLYAGVLAGIALLCKTTILPLTLAMLAFAFLAWMLIRHFVLRLPLAASVRASGAFVFAAAVIPIPFVLVALPDTVRYVTQVLLSKKSEQFLLSTPGSVVQEATFYLSGPGGQLTIGRWYWCVAFVIAASLLAIAKSRNWALLARGVAIGTVIASAYASISIPQLKSPFFGTAFAFLLMLASIRCICTLIGEQHGFKTQAIASLGIGLASIAMFHFPTYYRPYGNGQDAKYQALKWNGIVSDVLESVSGLSSYPQRVYFTTIYEFLNPDTLQWVNDRRMLSNKFIAVLHPGEESEYDQALDSATAAIVFDLGVVAPHSLTPREEHERQAREIESGTGFRFIRSFSLPDGQVFARLYQRMPAFSGIDADHLGCAQIVNEIETYGEDGYSRRRTFPVTTRSTSKSNNQFELMADRTGQYLVEASMISPGEGATTVETFVDGGRRATAQVGPAWDALRFKLELKEGRHTLDISIKGAGGNDVAGTKLTFRRLQFLALPN